MSSNNSIEGNKIINNDFGIWFHGSSYHNNIVKNKILNNGYGIRLWASSDYNTISENNITASSKYGIFISSSSNNKIYHNFLDNTNQVYFDTGFEKNIWDDGYPYGGNYWSDYAGADANGDGIGDTPYVIDANNQDRYPLMKPYVLGDLNRDGKVDEDDLWHFAAAFIDYYKIHVLDPLCDFNKDGKIDEDDLWTMAAAFIDYWKAH